MIFKNNNNGNGNSKTMNCCTWLCLVKIFSYVLPAMVNKDDNNNKISFPRAVKLNNVIGQCYSMAEVAQNSPNGDKCRKVVHLIC